MPRATSDDDDWDDEEWPDDDDSSETFPCSNCGAEVYDDSIRCPVCGEYVTHLTHPMTGRPMWFALLGLIGIIAVIATCLVFLR